MYWQPEIWMCGPCAISNALRFYGDRVSPKKAARLAGTTEEGSDHHDLLQAIDSLGYSPAELDTDHREEARRWLLSVGMLAPLILSVDKWAHWVAVAGYCAGRFSVIDSTLDRRGDFLIQPARPKRILPRWRAARAQREDGGLYYGIAVLDSRT